MLQIDEQHIGIPQLRAIPWQLGKWQASGEQSMEDIVAQYLKPDEYILREYVDPGNGLPIGVFVAYFKSLQNNYGPHSPRICLPGSGWLVDSVKIVRVPVPGRTDGIPVNEYIMEKSEARILVLYWYQNDRDSWAEEFHAKLRLLPDLIRYRRSDVSLVRLITPLRGLGAQEELSETLAFTKFLYPQLVDRFSSVSARPR
jgi:EpsI family protein